VRDVQSRAGPLGEHHRTRTLPRWRRLRGPRGEVRERIGAPGGLELRLAARHDRGVLRVHRAAQPEPCEDLEALEHRPHPMVPAGRRRCLPMKHLKLETPAGGERLELADIVLVEQAVDAIVDVGLARRDALLDLQRFQRAGRRIGVWHLEHGGHAATRRRRPVPVCQSSLWS